MTNTSKMTYVDALNFAIENLTDDAVVEKLTALRDQQVKRNSADRKPTKAQKENMELKTVVLDVLTTDPATVTEVMARDTRLATLSNQKVSALLHALVAEDKVTKTVEKRVSKFALA